MNIPIPIIDIFAGPGGLGEGFSSFKAKNGTPIFKIKLSIEKDISAHQTLELRAFYRQFAGKTAPPEYYQYLRGTISREKLFEKYIHEAALARTEAWRATLGEEDRNLVRSRIREALNGASDWVLIGGPPCQAYSLVGRSRMMGEDKAKYESDDRHFLYREYLRILADHQPPVFVMENVKGLLSARLLQQKTFDLILSDLQNPAGAIGHNTGEPLSYTLFSISNKRLASHDKTKPEDYIVRSEEYGIPQARHRIIILGIRSDFYKSEPEILERVRKQVAIDEVIGDLPRLRSGLSKEEDSPDQWYAAIKTIENAIWLDSVSIELRNALVSSLKRVGKKLTRGDVFLPSTDNPREHGDWYVDKMLQGVSNHETRAHIRKDLHRYFFAAVFSKINGRSPNLIDFPKELLPDHKNVQEALDGSKFNDRFRVQVCGKPSTTVVSHISKDGHYYVHYDPLQCRSLTVREAARLQTFPDNYYFEGNRTQQYHQVGNAVPPLLAKKIAEIVFNVLKNPE